MSVAVALKLSCPCGGKFVFRTQVLYICQYYSFFFLLLFTVLSILYCILDLESILLNTLRTTELEISLVEITVIQHCTFMLA